LESPSGAAPDSAARIDTLGALTRHWKFIALSVAVVTVLAAIISLFIPKTYRAEAVLLVNPSPYKSSSLEQSPLDVDIYEKMGRSPSLIEEVKTLLKIEDISVEELLNKMKVVLTKRTSQRETTFAPLLLLQVEDRSPVKCQAIANAWADLATSASLRVKSAVMLQANERIRKQFKDTKDLLEKKEDLLKGFDTTATLIEHKAELELMRTQLAAEQDNLQGLYLQSSVAQTRLGDLKRKYASFFVKGVWVGSLQAPNGTSSTGTTPLTLSAPDPLTTAASALASEKTDSLPLQFLFARNALVEKNHDYAEYKVKQGVDIKKRTYDILINKIARFEQDLEDLRLTLATDKAKLQQLETIATSVPQRLTVIRAITDQALWMAVAASRRPLDETTSKRLVSEDFNPMWLSAQGRIQYLKPEIASIEARLKTYEELLKQLREQQGTLDREVVVQTQEAKNRENEMQMAKDRYDALSQQFLGISHNIMLQESESARLREEITNSQQQVARLTSGVLTLTNYTVAKELEHERLQRELTSVKNIYTTLATKSEEARITELEVSGDLQVAFHAVVPQDKIRPKRTQIVGAAFLCALVVFGLIAVGREHLLRQLT